jgi:ABC-type transport system substrate-binding protein
VNGRAANAADIKFHIERNKAGKLMDGTSDPNFYRKPLFEVVDKVEAVDDRTAKVTLARPWPFFLNTLAGSWTKVQAPEAVAKFEADYSKYSADQIIGTGDFMLTSFSAEGNLQFRRHPKAIPEPWWDGVDFVPLFVDAAGQQAAFEQRQVDGFAPPSDAVGDDLKKRLSGKIYETKVFTPNPIASTFYGGAPPWQDQRLIGAIMQVMDRRGLVQQLVGGNGTMSAWIPPAWAPFALPEKDLVTFPGYLEDREKDIADAKAKWAAAGGDKLGEIIVDIPDIFEGTYAGVGVVITNHLKSILGNDFTIKLEPYATVTAKIVGQQYGNGANNIWFGWINPPSDPDPSIDYILGMNSKSTQFAQWAVKMEKMDSITDKLAAEFDVNKRIDLCHEAARETLRYTGGGIPALLEGISKVLWWNYIKLGEPTHQNNQHNAGRNAWFDQTDPTWAGRG